MHGDKYCEHCNNFAETVVPALWVRGAKFTQGKVSMKISMFGGLAGELLGITALRAQQLEEQAILKRDENRTLFRPAIAANIDCVYNLSVDVKIMKGDANKPRIVSITAYSLSRASAAAASALASPKRAAGVDIQHGVESSGSASALGKRPRV